MIALVLDVVQTEFQSNWTGEIHFGNDQYEAVAAAWININVEPIDTEGISYDGCVNEEYALYITVYERNQMQAAKLADEVINFIQQRQLNGLHTRTWRPVTNGMVTEGKAFYKFSVPVDITSKKDA